MRAPLRTTKQLIEKPTLTRRDFARTTAMGVLGAGAACAVPGLGAASPRMRRVVVMSDIHVGRKAGGRDGLEWLGESLSDLRSLGPIDYGLALGDLTHHGDRASLERLLSLRDTGPVQKWFELAGNHEYWRGGIRDFKQLLRPTDPYCVLDGNIAWYFLSDERPRVPGYMTRETYLWLKESLSRHRDKIIVFCTHQLIPGTLPRSDEPIFHMHPQRQIAELFAENPIALSLCGHEHHSPYSKTRIRHIEGTTFINVASVSHAYGTGTSGSIVLEFEENGNEIVARRRDHDRHRYRESLRIRIPLDKRIHLSTPDGVSSSTRVL